VPVYLDTGPPVQAPNDRVLEVYAGKYVVWCRGYPPMDVDVSPIDAERTKFTVSWTRPELPRRDLIWGYRVRITQLRPSGTLIDEYDVAGTRAEVTITDATSYLFSVRVATRTAANQLTQFGPGFAAVCNVATGDPPVITKLEQGTYNVAYTTITGTASFTLRALTGARAGQTWVHTAGGKRTIGSLTGTETWRWENAYGNSQSFRTVAGTAGKAAIAGVVRNTYASPLPSGRGSMSTVAWGTTAFTAQSGFPFSAAVDGNTGTRWQSGNVPVGWLQLALAIPANYRLRRWAVLQGSTVTENIAWVYFLLSGGAGWVWNEAFGWLDVATQNMGSSGVLNSDTFLTPHTSITWLWGPYIREYTTPLSARTVYIRVGIRHTSGAAGANMGEVAVEYQTADTPAVAEVKATIVLI
jgi:hypothetical protein